jgi:type II secretory pathway pseudopilin PulG
MFSPHNKQALSMVEILVVISLVAILIALLLPSITKYLRDAQGWQCLSKQRRLATACLQFSADNEGRLPVTYARVINENGQASFHSNWYRDVEPYIGEPPSQFLRWLRCSAAKETNVLTIGVHTGRPGFGQPAPCVQGDNVDRRPAALVPLSTALTGCTGNNVGSFLSPVGWRFNIDMDGDGLRDSHSSSLNYNGLRFLHQGRAAVVCMDGSARLIVPLDWVENRGNLWGVKDP